MLRFSPNSWRVLAVVAVHAVVSYLSPKRVPLAAHEAVFREEPANSKAPVKPFPSILDPPSVDLSIVLPAYKEEKRCARACARFPARGGLCARLRANARVLACDARGA